MSLFSDSSASSSLPLLSPLEEGFFFVPLLLSSVALDLAFRFPFLLRDWDIDDCFRLGVFVDRDFSLRFLGFTSFRRIVMPMQ